MTGNRRGFSIRLLTPMVLASTAITLAVVLLYMFFASRQNTVDVAANSAISTINQFKTLRGYYTRNIVSKVKKAGSMEITFDHSKNPRAIPLPATMIHDLSALLSAADSGVQLRLYSEFPFPNRAGRKLDGFAQAALANFRSAPDSTFIRAESVDGQELVRVAIADKLVAQGCVNCHNTRPDTPKSNWKLGDVRGVLEVISPVSAQIAANYRMMAEIVAVALRRCC